MKLLDTCERRIRFSPPQPRGTIELRESDLETFRTIHRHGPLPSHYLFAFTSKKSFPRFQDRLTTLYNEGYLSRPPQQFESFRARYQHLVYDLTEKSEKLIQLSPYVQRGDPWVHRLMGACVSASLELMCRKKGLRFIPRHEILSRKEKHMKLPLSRSASREFLVPDELFGIDYGGSFRFFACEWDRGTEPIRRTALDQTDFGKKVDAYLEVIKNRTYKDEWDIPGLVVLTATVNETRAQSLMADLTDRFSFKVIEEFASPWRIPAILDVATWQSVRGSFDISSG